MAAKRKGSIDWSKGSLSATDATVDQAVAQFYLTAEEGRIYKTWNLFCQPGFQRHMGWHCQLVLDLIPWLETEI